MGKLCIDYLNYLDCSIHSTIAQSEDEEGWKLARKDGIGGSDIGGICGVSKYTSPRIIYLQKTGQYEINFSERSKENMAWGHKLEPTIIKELEERHNVIAAPGEATYKNKVYRYALANVDSFIVDKDGIPEGILEAKTAGFRSLEQWEKGEVPLYYLYQLQWYMFVTGLTYGIIGCLVGGQHFFSYKIYRDDDLVADMIKKARSFWVNVEKLVEPDITGNDADVEYLQGTRPIRNDVADLSDSSVNAYLHRIAKLKANIKGIEKELAECENYVKDAIKDHEEAATVDFEIKYKVVSTNRVNSKKLREDMPDLWEQYKTTTSSRRFSFKQVNDDEL